LLLRSVFGGGSQEKLGFGQVNTIFEAYLNFVAKIDNLYFRFPFYNKSEVMQLQDLPTLFDFDTLLRVKPHKSVALPLRTKTKRKVGISFRHFPLEYSSQ
jgi:hypothetical protein